MTLEQKPTIARVVLATACLFATIGAAGCAADEDMGSGTATVRGVVTDKDSNPSLLGGTGTASSTSWVQASIPARDGQLEVVADAEVAADGSYEIVVPADEPGLVIEAKSEAADTLASVLVDTGSAGTTTVAAPMTTETSVEARVFVQLVAQGSAEQPESSLAELRSRIDSRTAVAVRGVMETRGDATAELNALAEGIQAAAEARAQALSSDAGSPQGTSPARAEILASLAYRTTVEARLSTGDVVEVVVQASAEVEARAWAESMQALFAAANATTEVRGRVEAAGTALISDVSTAASAEAIAAAYAQFSAELIGESSVTGSILGAHLNANATTAITIDATIELAVAATARFDTALQSSVAAIMETFGTADMTLVADAIVSKYSMLRAEVGSTVSDNGQVFPDVELATSVLLAATASFSAGQ
jgi:hypothetical protein